MGAAVRRQVRSSAVSLRPRRRLNCSNAEDQAGRPGACSVRIEVVRGYLDQQSPEDHGLDMLR